MPVYPVSGNITFEGEPMAGGGSITFIPTGNQPGKAPGGEIDDTGHYVLSTYGQGDGAIAGGFRVVITQATSEEPEATPDGVAPKQSNNALPEKLFIPAIYSDANKSPLNATVETKSNEINFQLKRQESAPVEPVRRPNEA
ncbi:MAG: hypothetical protein JWM11_7744 [Planctomycetaceae bacterium]|nr:hypothetical protein [Planctomycetaceae bacterium]